MKSKKSLIGISLIVIFVFSTIANSSAAVPYIVGEYDYRSQALSAAVIHQRNHCTQFMERQNSDICDASYIIESTVAGYPLFYYIAQTLDREYQFFYENYDEIDDSDYDNGILENGYQHYYYDITYGGFYIDITIVVWMQPNPSSPVAPPVYSPTGTSDGSSSTGTQSGTSGGSNTGSGSSGKRCFTSWSPITGSTQACYG